MEIMELLKNKLEKYGVEENICFKEELLGNWEKNVFIGEFFDFFFRV